MSEISNMPERPLYLHEVRLIQEENDEVHNSEALFYKGNNLNATICVFVNIEGTGYIVAFDNEEENWKQLTSMSEEEGNVSQYNENSSNVVQWINERYGEDGYGIYQMFGSQS